MTGNDTKFTETLKLLKGEDFLIGFDYADIVSVLGDHISRKALDAFWDENKELPETVMQSFFENVGFETLAGGASREEISSFARFVAEKGLKKGIILLFTNYGVMDVMGGEVPDLFRNCLPEDVEVQCTARESKEDIKRISVWYR